MIPYQKDWPAKFSSEKELLQKLFGAAALQIEHIGSSSIPGLCSKPIVDIAIMIENHEEADAYTEPLSKVGYKFHSLSTERHFYTKGDPIEYHVSIAYANRGGFWKRQILFRDYLRTHFEARDEYAALKTDLLKKAPTGKGEYLSGKTDFVYKILTLAGWKKGQKFRD